MAEKLELVCERPGPFMEKERHFVFPSLGPLCDLPPMKGADCLSGSNMTSEG